jgi:hypothetical protein
MNIYTHIHHIIPRHMGGTDDPSNLIELTVEEHAEAHMILYREHGKIEDLWAYQLLSNQITAKEGFAKVLTKNAKDTHAKQKQRGTGIADSQMQSAKGKIGAKAAGLGVKNNPNGKRICCLGCHKDINKPTFVAWHLKHCF